MSVWHVLCRHLCLTPILFIRGGQVQLVDVFCRWHISPHNTNHWYIQSLLCTFLSLHPSLLISLLTYLLLTLYLYLTLTHSLTHSVPFPPPPSFRTSPSLPITLSLSCSYEHAEINIAARSLSLSVCVLIAVLTQLSLPSADRGRLQIPHHHRRWLPYQRTDMGHGKHPAKAEQDRSTCWLKQTLCGACHPKIFESHRHIHLPHCMSQAGTEAFASMMRAYYRGAAGAIIAYAISSYDRCSNEIAFLPRSLSTSPMPVYIISLSLHFIAPRCTRMRTQTHTQTIVFIHLHHIHIHI